MVIQDSLVARVDKFIRKLRSEMNLEEYIFSVTKSKTTNSLYVAVISYVQKERIRLTYRFSDHGNSKVKTKIVCRTTSFKFIERKILRMIKKVKRMRCEKQFELLERKRDEKNGR